MKICYDQGLQWRGSCHSNKMTPLPILLATVFLCTGNCPRELFSAIAALVFVKFKGAFDWEIRAKSEKGFHLREICPQGGFQLRNPNPDFLDFPFCCSIGKSKKGFAKLFSWTVVFSLLSMRARARLLFLRTVFQILFRICQSNGKNENPKTGISALKSVFGFRVRLQIRNLDFKI